MSVAAITAVYRHSRAQKEAFAVMLALADHANDYDEAFPSVPYLAIKARCSERHARRCLRELEDLGEIQAVGKGRRGVTVYRICFEILEGRPNILERPYRERGPRDYVLTPAPGADPRPARRRSKGSTTDTMSGVADGDEGVDRKPTPDTMSGVDRTAGTPTPDTMSGDPRTPESAEPSGEPTEEPSPPSPPKGGRRDCRQSAGIDWTGDLEASFEAFVRNFPTGRLDPAGPAKEIFGQLVADGVDADLLVEAAAAYAGDVEAADVKPCFMRTFLTERRFENYGGPVVAPPTMDSEAKAARDVARKRRDELAAVWARAVDGLELEPLDALSVRGLRLDEVDEAGSAVLLAPSRINLDAGRRNEVAIVEALRSTGLNIRGVQILSGLR